MQENRPKIPRRVLNTLFNALLSGVVPRIGAPYIAIGRQAEIKALLSDLENAREGGAAVRFLIGRYGSGKSFLIQLIRGHALEENFVTADCDLSPERRLSGGNGGGIATYRELIRNMATRSAPDGSALQTLLMRYYTDVSAALIDDGLDPEGSDFLPALRRRIHKELYALSDSVGGFDFAAMLSAYYTAVIEENHDKAYAVLKWLRGEYSTKTEAREALGTTRVNTLIGDDNWYDFLKIWALFVRLIGYSGLSVYIDECVNLYKIPNRISREANYEKLLAIFNDAMEGRAIGLSVLFGGTPQFLEDPRRGLFSYEALRSRLADSRMTELGYRTEGAPVIRLPRLSDNEMLALLSRLAKLYAEKESTPSLVTSEEMQVFLEDSMSRVGAEEAMTPREIIRNFLSLLSVIRNYPDTDFASLMHRISHASVKEESEKTEAPGQAPSVSRFTLSDIDI